MPCVDSLAVKDRMAEQLAILRGYDALLTRT
jgi:hypothetical protein